MDNQSAPPPAEVSNGYFSREAYKINASTFTCLISLILFVNYLIAFTRFRLWHSNWILVKFTKLLDSPLTWLISYCASQLSTAPYNNDLYLIWLVVLTITYENVITISTASCSRGASWLLRESVPLFNVLYVGAFINRNDDARGYQVPLLILWFISVAKFLLRLVSHEFVKRAYGLNNSKLIADYMKIEHEQLKPNEEIDPINMRGYKYLVMGEEQIKEPKIEGPKYGAKVELPKGVVTLEKVWSCNERLLDPSIDTDNELKDVCLSFAFFKLLKRQYFNNPTAEAKQEKTRRLVFEGLLSSKDHDRVYRVIDMEIGFLRDLLHTRYPLTFAIGFPIFHVLLLTGMFGVSVWISSKAFLRHDNPHADYLRINHKLHTHNIDYTITNILLIMITLMEALETLSYVFSDWTKVVLICHTIKSRMLPHQSFFFKVLAVPCKWKFFPSLNNTIGQYSLLENYHKDDDNRSWVNYFEYFRYSKWGWNFKEKRYSKWGWSPGKVAPRGTKEDKAVALSLDVKREILSSLRSLKGYPMNGVASLERNLVYNDLAWTCALQTEFHTLIVWHIATSLCDIHPVKYTGNNNSMKELNLLLPKGQDFSAPDSLICGSATKLKLIFKCLNPSGPTCQSHWGQENLAPQGTGDLLPSMKHHHSVANHLSRYCAYLLVFLPDMLPESNFSLKLFFRAILLETKEFFHKAPNPKDKYELMMHGEYSGNKVIDEAVKLGKQLMQIPDDARRWKIMADFWSEFIIFLAPSGKAAEHFRLLESGGEFITHLWALLYHAGIVDPSTTVSSGDYP